MGRHRSTIALVALSFFVAQASQADVPDANVALATPPAGVSTTAEAGPRQSPSIQLEPMQGPFASLAAFCARQPQKGRSCVPAPNPWDTAERRGARGPFLSAALVKTMAKVGSEEVAYCAVALRTAQGWFVSSSEDICQGRVRGGTLSTEVDRFRWADEIGLGVLLVQTQNSDEVTVPRHRWWGEMTTRFASQGSSRILCGMGTNERPACTRALVDSCTWGGLDGGMEAVIQVVNGTLRVGPEGIRAKQCLRYDPAPGTYALAFKNVESRPSQWVPNKENREVEAEDSLTGTQAFGPFPSRQQYCEDLPNFGNWEESREDERPTVSPRPRHRSEHCSAPGGWRGELGTSGPLLGAQLVRVQNNLAGATIYHCRVGMRTSAGWFFSTDYETCQGVLGPCSSAHIRIRGLSWLKQGVHPLFLIDAAAGATCDEEKVNSPNTLDPLFGDPGLVQPGGGAPSSWVKKKEGKYLGPTTRRVRLCGVGASGLPSCTGWVDAGCIRPNGTTTHTVKSEGSQLELSPSGKLAPEEEGLCSLERETFKVRLP